MDIVDAAMKEAARITDKAFAEQDATISALRKRVEELEGALDWVEPAMHALTSYEKDYGEPLPEDRQIGKIDDSRNSASFRLYVGHIRRMHAALRAKGGEHGE